MSPRILIGFREIAGYYRNLKLGFDELGISSAFLCFNRHPFNYGIGSNPSFVALINRIVQRIEGCFQKRWLTKIIWLSCIQPIFSLPIFIWCLFRYDVFIFSSVSTFFFFLDLPLLKLFGKKIIYVFHGSDSRPAYLNGYVITENTPRQVATALFLARTQKSIIRIIDRFADHIVNIPPQSHFHSRPITNGYTIGLPCTVSVGSVMPQRGEDVAAKITRILHAPSKPGPKGSAEIRGAIERLKQAGHKIEYLELVGRPNAEVLAELSRCDFVVDEIYSDTPMAGLAAEAACFRKPTIVGGYESAKIARDIPADCLPPSLFCHPAEIESAMLRLISDPLLRKNLGESAFQFVSTKWSRVEVAKRYLRLIEGAAPESWLFDPQRIEYVRGCGISETRLRDLLSKILRMGGQSGLCLGDKPDLQRQLIEFVADGAKTC